MKPTNIKDPEFFHKVVDCQYACPAHTPVPEYIRLIAEGQYTDAYMINWHSNVFPGVLGRVCDRPCEPACRRGDGSSLGFGYLAPVERVGDFGQVLQALGGLQNGFGFTD